MKTIEITNARARKPEWSMAEPVTFTLNEGEHIAIVGRNGAGKSMFVDMLTGRHPAFPGMVRYGFDEPYNNLKHITTPMGGITTRPISCNSGGTRWRLTRRHQP